MTRTTATLYPSPFTMEDTSRARDSLSPSQQEALDQYMQVTNQDADAAIPLLQRSEWNVQVCCLGLLCPLGGSITEPPIHRSRYRSSSMVRLPTHLPKPWQNRMRLPPLSASRTSTRASTNPLFPARVTAPGNRARRRRPASSRSNRTPSTGRLSSSPSSSHPSTSDTAWPPLASDSRYTSYPSCRALFAHGS